MTKKSKLTRHFWRDFKTLFTKPLNYLFIARGSWWYVFRLFWLGMVITGLISATYLAVHTFPRIERATPQIAEATITHFPENAVFEWDGQNITIENTAEPYEVAWPSELPQWVEVENIVGLYEQEPSSDQLSDTFIGLYGNQILVLGVEAVGTTISDTFTPPITVSNETIEAQVNQVEEYVLNALQSTQIMIFILYPLFGPVIFLLLYGFYVAMTPLLLLLNGYQKPLTRGIKLGLLIAVPAAIIDQLSRLITPDHQVPLMSIVYWVIVLLILWQSNQQLVVFRKKIKKQQKNNKK